MGSWIPSPVCELDGFLLSGKFGFVHKAYLVLNWVIFLFLVCFGE